MKTFAHAALLLWASIVLADTPVPATVEFMFDPAAPQGIKKVVTGDAGYLKEIRQSAGTITNGWWHVASVTSFGQGNLQFELDRTKLAGDLALILHADWQKDTDVAVQLYDAQGRAIALDLFGEMRRNAQTAGTDTFVIPLDRYPDATSIMVRRLSGDLRIIGGGLYPVVSEIASKAENEKALAQQLGVIISPHHWMFGGEGNRELPGASDRSVGQVHAVLPLERTNQVGAAALRQGRYPGYRPLTTGPLIPPKLSLSNTTEGIVKSALRMVALQSGRKEVKPPLGSSDFVADQILHQGDQMGFMSIALSSAEKEEFFRARAYPPVEITFARDALQILVNSQNAIPSVTIPQLDAIFGRELRAGAPALIHSWSQMGGGGGEIQVVAGSPGYGTSRVFQQLVLKGGRFREDVVPADVVYASGVEKNVSDNSSAIGYATLRPRNAKVRAIAVAGNSGEHAYFPDAESIYAGKYPLQRMFFGYVAAPSLEQSSPFERELINLLLSDVGQTLVARAGSLPLMASEVVAERAKLGLPQ